MLNLSAYRQALKLKKMKELQPLNEHVLLDITDDKEEQKTL